MGQDLCSKCDGLCCKYFALEIDKPETRRQFDDIRWHLCHEGVTVFIEKKKWFLGIKNRCKYLTAENRCGIYEKRPRVCRQYSTHNCEYYGDDSAYDKLFTTPEQIEEYAAEKLKRPKARRRPGRTSRKA